MPDAKFEAHIRTTAWYQVLFEAAKENDTAASEYRMARMAAQEAWSAAGREAEQDAASIRKAAQSVLDWTEAKHRPPVPEAIPCGEMAYVRVHALVELHAAVTATKEHG